MKFHRVEGNLPAHVAMIIAQRAVSPVSNYPLPVLKDLLNNPGIAFSSERFFSNVPTKITLDVPEAAAAETARVLRAMADELMGGK
jgi:hypothetical protein